MLDSEVVSRLSSFSSLPDWADDGLGESDPDVHPKYPEDTIGLGWENDIRA